MSADLVVTVKGQPKVLYSPTAKRVAFHEWPARTVRCGGAARGGRREHGSGPRGQPPSIKPPPGYQAGRRRSARPSPARPAPNSVSDIGSGHDEVVTGVRVGDRVDTQRRRANAFPETYETRAL